MTPTTYFCLLLGALMVQAPRHAGTFALREGTAAELFEYPQIDPSGRSRYPYLASLRARRPGSDEATHFCGGALVGPSHVLVAASCLFDNVVFDPEVHLGRAYPVMSDQAASRQFAEVITTAAVHFPPGWKPGVPETADTALIQLERPSQYTPVRLPQSKQPLQPLPQLRSLGWAPTGLRDGEYFMDVSVVELKGSSPDTANLSTVDSTNSTRPLVWVAQQMPANWCDGDSGRMLIVRGPPGGAEMSGGDLLAGLQSEESPAACHHMMGALQPRLSAFTPLTDSPSTVRWIKEVMRRHREGKEAETALSTTVAEKTREAGVWGAKSNVTGCERESQAAVEFQSLPLCRWVEDDADITG